MTHVSGNVLLLADIDQNFYRITSSGVVNFLGNMDHVAKGLAFISKPSQNFDTDGDGKNDIGVYWGGGWFILRSSDGGVTSVGWGIAQDTPVPADYDGDGKTDITVYRVGTWYILRSSDGVQIAVGWGVARGYAGKLITNVINKVTNGNDHAILVP
jgi:hypothetical protein